ncbi:MAG: DUF3194 domain-containing protein [Desulfurococcaceae archaeon]|jgi:hypothetical protein|nr:DUF3194 domain-containing protein [Desulfurococcaceae archaeon]MCC6057794.1 DUF3194 domain-containing protein [Desulfurococcaceae archaeon]
MARNIKSKTVDVEEIGLDLKNISDKDLEEIAQFLEQCIKDEIGKLLSEKVIGYVSTISIEINNDIIKIAINLEVDSYITPQISLEKILDQVLRHVFERARQYLASKFRKTEETNTKF